MPFVTVIVPTHLDENAGYLELCLESILSSQDIDFEIICIADTKNPPKRYMDPRVRMYWDKTLVTASDKFNWAIKQVNPSSKYIWFISDDVMITPQTMKVMVLGMAENAIICNPMSNSDNGSQFWTELGIPVKCSKEDLPLDIPKSNGIPFLIPVLRFVSFYCTMIPKKVIEIIGELDGKLDYRHNDEDYCIRARMKGVVPMINLGAFALHFGGKTIPKCISREQLDECSKLFLEKYGQTLQ